MRKKNYLAYGIAIAIILFILAVIFFNDVSFNLVGLGIIIIGITLMIYMNFKK